MMKSKIVLPLLGSFKNPDKYCRKHWIRARWRKEFLLKVQQRQKWLKPQRNACVDDFVIIKDDDLPRNRWQLVRVSAVNHSADGQVRTVQVALAESSQDSKGKRVVEGKFLERPVHKLVLLMPKEEQAEC